MDEKKDLVSEKSEIGNAKYCSYVDGLYVYKDPQTSYEYAWDEQSKRWLPKASSGGPSGVQFDGQSYNYTDKDGTVYEWDQEKSAWFPKVNSLFFFIHSAFAVFLTQVGNQLINFCEINNN